MTTSQWIQLFQVTFLFLQVYLRRIVTLGIEISGVLKQVELCYVFLYLQITHIVRQYKGKVNFHRVR
jgi:hypothetical protein